VIGTPDCPFSQDYPGMSHLRITDVLSLQSSIWTLIADWTLIGVMDIYIYVQKLKIKH
jgi:hypothetical protein